MNKISDFFKQVLAGKSIYRILFNWQVEKHCQDLRGVVVDFGSGKNPSYYQYLKLENTKLVRVDSDAAQNPDLVVDLNQPRLSFEDESADSAFMFNMIYILKNPQLLLGEVRRILKKNGKLFLSSPFILNETPEPDDFARYTSQKLKEFLTEAGFRDFKIIPFGERFSAAAYLTRSFMGFNFLRLAFYASALALDKLIPQKIRKTYPCPLGYFVIAVK